MYLVRSPEVVVGNGSLPPGELTVRSFVVDPYENIYKDRRIHTINDISVELGPYLTLTLTSQESRRVLGE